MLLMPLSLYKEVFIMKFTIAKKIICENVGAYCLSFRKDVLNISLRDFSKLTHTSEKNVSAFEHGRANNLLYIFLYEQFCMGDKNKKIFRQGLFDSAPDLTEIMKGGFDNE